MRQRPADIICEGCRPTDGHPTAQAISDTAIKQQRHSVGATNWCAVPARCRHAEWTRPRSRCDAPCSANARRPSGRRRRSSVRSDRFATLAPHEPSMVACEGEGFRGAGRRRPVAEPTRRSERCSHFTARRRSPRLPLSFGTPRGRAFRSASCNKTAGTANHPAQHTHTDLHLPKCATRSRLGVWVGCGASATGRVGDVGDGELETLLGGAGLRRAPSEQVQGGCARRSTPLISPGRTSVQPGAERRAASRGTESWYRPGRCHSQRRAQKQERPAYAVL